MVQKMTDILSQISGSKEATVWLVPVRMFERELMEFSEEEPNTKILKS